MSKGQKKTIIILSTCILVLVIIYFVGVSLISFETEGDIETIEINYQDENYKLPEVKCSFLGLSADVSEPKVDIDVNEMGEGSVKYTCKKLIFIKTKTFKVKVMDKEPPVITLNGKENSYVYLGNTYKEKGATAKDNIDGDLSDNIKIEGEVDSSKLGEYQIKYSVTDKTGNVGELIRKVIVREKPSEMSCGEKGVIYLTFDDGPSNKTTPKILDTLKKYDVKATFFVTNTNGGDDSLIKREHDEGHVVAVHSATHEYSIIYKSSEAYWDDFDKVSNRIYDITGVRPDLFRFPGGSSNTVSRKYHSGIMTQLVKEANEKGYSYFDWNEDSLDAGNLKSPTLQEKIKEEVKASINSFSKSKGNVILMHDIKETTEGALEEIIKYGLDNGYKFDVLDDSIICHQRVNN